MNSVFGINCMNPLAILLFLILPNSLPSTASSGDTPPSGGPVNADLLAKRKAFKAAVDAIPEAKGQEVASFNYFRMVEIYAPTGLVEACKVRWDCSMGSLPAEFSLDSIVAKAQSRIVESVVGPVGRYRLIQIRFVPIVLPKRNTAVVLEFSPGEGVGFMMGFLLDGTPLPWRVRYDWEPSFDEPPATPVSRCLPLEHLSEVLDFGIKVK